MTPRRPTRGWIWLVAGLLAFSAGPSSIVVAWEPSCRMDCASTDYCCCKPRASKKPIQHATLDNSGEGRESCPEGCSTLALPAQAKSSIAVTPGSVGRDASATTTWASDDRLVDEAVHLDVDARAPPQLP